MERLGARLAAAVGAGAVIFLRGELGAGKTTLVRGFLRALGVKATVKSPTYTLVEPYALDGITVYHFDFYRVQDPAELGHAGVRDYFSQHAICLIEWPERGGGVLPVPDLELTFSITAPSARAVAIVAAGPVGETALTALASRSSMGKQ